MLNMPHPRHGQHQACTPRKSCNRGSENSVARREIGDGRCAYPSSKRHEWKVVDGWNNRDPFMNSRGQAGLSFSDRQAPTQNERKRLLEVGCEPWTSETQRLLKRKELRRNCPPIVCVCV